MTAPDLTEAARFLALIAPGERVTFQTFDDTARKDRKLSRILHGTLAEHAETLAGLNARGAGVFFMVNAGDGKQRNTDCVQRVRALFLDLDGSPLEPVQAASLPPHSIVESSPDRWHAYWRVSDCPLERFKPMQQAMAAQFAGDVKVCDLPRVMRLPGFDHRKGVPFRTRLVTARDALAYTLAELIAAFGPNTSNTLTMPTSNVKPMRRTLPDAIPEGERNITLLSLAAGLVRKGHDRKGVTDRLQRINAERCKPPLCATEADAIAARAIGYGSDGFTILRDDLLDSAEWKTLAPPVHDIIVMAFRRFDGFNNGNIALTFADFAGRDGFGNDRTFYKHRYAAIASGILVLVSEGGMTQTGRKPDLFAIAPQWLPDTSANGKNDRLRMPSKIPSYIDKQLSGDSSSGRASGRKPKKDMAA